jgi:hypothetical protein
MTYGTPIFWHNACRKTTIMATKAAFLVSTWFNPYLATWTFRFLAPFDHQSSLAHAFFSCFVPNWWDFQALVEDDLLAHVYMKWSLCCCRNMAYASCSYVCVSFASIQFLQSIARPFVCISRWRPRYSNSESRGANYLASEANGSADRNVAHRN